MDTTTPAIVAIVGLVVTLPPSFVALRALVRRQGRVREDPESCNALNRIGETLELSNVTPEPPKTANSGSVGIAVVASDTKNEQLEGPIEFSEACDQVCKEERVQNREQSLPVDKIDE